MGGHKVAGPENPENLVLQPRNVEFDWSGLPLHWVPNEPMVTHTINVLHLLLPEGERWFIDVFKQALPLVKDDKLREEVLGFIGQEVTHAESHQGVLDFWKTKGIDTDPYVEGLSWMFRKLLGDRNLRGRRRRAWLIERVAIVAAIEHITAQLGNWALNSPGLDKAGADPTMLDLLRWHGAEEVLHRNVAFDLFMHLDGRYLRRVRALGATVPIMIWLWIRGTAFMMRIDPELGGKVKPRWRDYLRASGHGMLPHEYKLVAETLRYLRPGFHPSQEYSSSQAAAYIASSPAATAAAA
jgi:hypothetical protein